jgi:hypothetical protein
VIRRERRGEVHHLPPAAPYPSRMRLLRRSRLPERKTAAAVRVIGFCPECGSELRNIRGTIVGAFEGECPAHGHVDDALTA